MQNEKFINIIKELKESGKGKTDFKLLRFVENMPMSEITSFKIGGPAKLFFEPDNHNALVWLLEILKKYDIPVYIMGNGSNILVRDGGYNGAIIRIGKNMGRVRVKENFIHAPGGFLLSSISKIAWEHGLSGLEFASGIPGGVGGAVFMNAGAYDGEISKIFRSCKVIKTDDLTVTEMFLEDMNYGYRHSSLEKEDGTPKGIILSAEFELQYDDKDKILEKMKDFNLRRNEKQPLNYPSAGSFFKRPEGFYAGKLIEDCGLKGLSFGAAEISAKHAGFIVNKGNAKASDVITLMNIARETVKDKFDVVLEPEVRIIGEAIET